MHRVLLFAFASLHSAATLASEATPEATLAARADRLWRCELSADMLRLHCVAQEPAVGTMPVARASAAEVNGTRFPLDPQRVWTVDLWSPPTEASWVRQLAQATICYRAPRCSVSLKLDGY